jgi:hypothetical protein
MAPDFWEPVGRPGRHDRVTLTHGAIGGVGHVPAGWRVVIDNEPSWAATVTARAIVGAAFSDGGRPGVISVQPEPHFTCGDLLRRGHLAMSLTL